MTLKAQSSCSNFPCCVFPVLRFVGLLQRSKQPNKGKRHESMGTLANTDDKEGLLSEYQKFRNAEAAEEAEGDE